MNNSNSNNNSNKQNTSSKFNQFLQTKSISQLNSFSNSQYIMFFSELLLIYNIGISLLNPLNISNIFRSKLLILFLLDFNIFLFLLDINLFFLLFKSTYYIQIKIYKNMNKKQIVICGNEIQNIKVGMVYCL